MIPVAYHVFSVCIQTPRILPCHVVPSHHAKVRRVVPRHRRQRHVPLTAVAWDNAAYFRMMGRNDMAWKYPWRLDADGKHMVSDRYHYLYNGRELERLLVLLEKVKAYPRSTFVVFHNDPEANSLINGFQLRHLIRRRQRVFVPRSEEHTSELQ